MVSKSIPFVEICKDTVILEFFFLNSQTLKGPLSVHGDAENMQSVGTHFKDAHGVMQRKEDLGARRHISTK